MSTLVFLHILAIGFWGGCVAVEMVLEFAALANPAIANPVARLHGRIDQWVEIPLMIAVLVTGALQLQWELLSSSLYLAKIGLGLGAVGANIYCLAPVAVRARNARTGTGSLQLDTRKVLVAFGIGFPCGIGALILGAQRIGAF